MRDCKKKLGLRDLIQTNDSHVTFRAHDPIGSLSAEKNPVSLFDIHKICGMIASVKTVPIPLNEYDSCFLTVEATAENFHRAVRGSWNRRDLTEDYWNPTVWRYWIRFNPQLAQRFIGISLAVRPEYSFLIFRVLSTRNMINNDQLYCANDTLSIITDQ